MTATQAAEDRYSIYTPDGENWGVWDARDQHFVDNPHITDHHRMLDFDSQRQAEQVRDELNAAEQAQTETPAEVDDSDDEPSAPSASEFARSVWLPRDHQPAQPHRATASPAGSTPPPAAPTPWPGSCST